MDKLRISYRIVAKTSELSAIPFSMYRDLMGKKLEKEGYSVVRRDIGKKVNWNRDQYKALFKRYSNKPNPYRIYLKLDESIPTDITPPKLIVDFLAKKGFHITDYLAGKAVNQAGREFGIGKVIGGGKNLNPELLSLYANDPQLQGLKGNFLVVISRHPYDILGASTDRGWTSCTQIGILNKQGVGQIQKHNNELINDKKSFGVNWHYTLADVEKGGLVAYLIDPNKQRDRKTGKSGLNPTARLSIRPFIDDDGNQVLWHSGTVYGTAPKSFQRTVEKWLKEFQHIKQDKVYNIDPDTYAEVKDARIKDKLLFTPSLELKSFIDRLKVLSADTMDGFFDELERQNKLEFIPQAIKELEKYDYLNQLRNFDKSIVKAAKNLVLLAESYDFLFKTKLAEKTTGLRILLSYFYAYTEPYNELIKSLDNPNDFRLLFVKSMVAKPQELNRLIIFAILDGIDPKLLNSRLHDVQDWIDNASNQEFFITKFKQICDTLYTVGFDSGSGNWVEDMLLDRYFAEFDYNQLTKDLNF